MKASFNHCHCNASSEYLDAPLKMSSRNNDDTKKEHVCKRYTRGVVAIN